MPTEVVVANQLPSPFLSSSVPAAAEPRLSLANVDAPEMHEVMKAVDVPVMTRWLTKRAVTKNTEIIVGDAAGNIRKTSQFPSAFFPDGEMVKFAIAMLAAIQDIFRARLFGSPEFLRYFYATARLGKGLLLALPTCLQDFRGGIFSLIGGSGSGKTEFLRRFCAGLPAPFYLKTAPTPSILGIWIFPCIHLVATRTTSVQDIIRTLHDYFVQHVATEGNFDDPFPGMLKGLHIQNEAVKACIAMNVGMIILDGLCLNNTNARGIQLLEFLHKLRTEGGIPVLISGTAAFAIGVEHESTLFRNLFNGRHHYLEPRAHPSKNDGEYEDIINSFWKSAGTPKGMPTPPGLSSSVHTSTHGIPSLTSLAMAKVIDSICTAEEFDFSKVKAASFGTAIERSMRPFKGAIAAYAAASVEADAVSEKVIRYVDYFPESLASKPRIRDWLEPAASRVTR